MKELGILIERNVGKVLLVVVIGMFILLSALTETVTIDCNGSPNQSDWEVIKIEDKNIYPRPIGRYDVDLHWKLINEAK